MNQLQRDLLRMGGVLALWAMCQLGFAATPMVVAGANHTCALQGGGVVCWGNNQLGQLGNGTPLQADGTYQSTALPGPVIGITDAVALSAGVYSTCAVLAGGSVRCWGDNRRGQLGDGTNKNTNAPVRVAGVASAVSVSVNGARGCAIQQAGTVVCWGEHFYNPSGTANPVANTEPPVQIREITQAKALSEGGGGRNCVATINGSVQCWGPRYYTTTTQSGGMFSFTTYQAGPADLVPVVLDGVTDVVQISEYVNSLCFLKRSGNLECRYTTQQGITTTAVALPDRATAISSPAQCAVLVTGRVQCTESSYAGQLRSYEIPPPLGSAAATVAGIEDAVSVATGNGHTCVALRSGAVKCWGRVYNGGTGTSTLMDYSPTPVTVSGIKTAVAISGPAGQACAVLADGSVQCWGTELGWSGGDPRPYATGPVAVPGVQDAVEITTGVAHACVLLREGTVQCWGDNKAGELGSIAVVKSTTPLVVPGVTDAIALAAGNGHTCALLRFGTVICWGANYAGQIGAGQGISNGVVGPMTVVGIGDAIAITATADGSCALRAGGSVACWGGGANALGLGGDGGTQNYSSMPVTVAGLTHVVGLSAQCAVTAAGSAGPRVWCWSLGKAPAPVTEPNTWRFVVGTCPTDLLALGMCFDARTPSTVPLWGALKTARFDPQLLDFKIAAACTLITDGTVKCIGSDAGGALGSGRPRDHEPAQVLGVGGTGTLNLLESAIAASADAVFTWAERAEPGIFTSLGRPSFSTEGYRVRHYANDHFLGVNETGTPHLYYKGPISNNDILDLGALSFWLAVATSR